MIPILLKIARTGLVSEPSPEARAEWREQAGRIAEGHAHDPSWHAWPLIEHAVIGNIVPDFPLINKSFNLSYSGADC